MANQNQKQKTATDVKLEAYTKGMQSNYSQYVASPNSWSYLENADTDRQGVLQTRPNIFIAGTAPANFLGAGVYERGLTTRWLIKAGNALYNVQSNTTSTGTLGSTSITFTSSSGTARFDTIQGCTVFACEGDGPRITTDGTTLGSFGSVRLGMPTDVDLISAGFVGRIWGAISNNNSATFIQDNVYYSDVIPSGGVTSTTGTGQFIKLNTQGKFLTGLVQFNNVLYAFTSDSIFRIYNTQSVDNAPFANVGAIRQEAIIKTFDAVYFLHYTGVYKLDSNGVSKVSQDIDNIFQTFNIPQVSTGILYTRKTFGWFDDQSIYFSIGMNKGWGDNDIDVDRTYVVKYNYLYKTWSLITLKDFDVSFGVSKFFSSYSGGVSSLQNLTPITLILGQNIADNVYYAGLYDIPTFYDGAKAMINTNSGEPLGDWSQTSSGGSTSYIRPIYVNAETQWLDFGLENHLKEIKGLSIPGESAEGFQLMYQIDNEESQRSDNQNAVWTPIGTLGKDYMTFFLDFKSKPFYRIKFKISGQTLGRKTSIGQITFLQVSDEGYGKN